MLMLIWSFEISTLIYWRICFSNLSIPFLTISRSQGHTSLWEDLISFICLSEVCREGSLESRTKGLPECCYVALNLSWRSVITWDNSSTFCLITSIIVEGVPSIQWVHNIWRNLCIHVRLLSLIHPIFKLSHSLLHEIYHSIYFLQGNLHLMAKSWNNILMLGNHSLNSSMLSLNS